VAAKLVVVLGLAAGLGLSCQVDRTAPPQPERPVVRQPAAVPQPARPPASQPEPEATDSEPATGPPRAEPPPAGPRAAIIFDDAGGRLADIEEIIGIGRPVTVAVLPGLAYSSEVARRASAAGLEVLLHLPLESKDGKRLGPGGVTLAMDDAQVQRTVRAGLASVPGAIGVNNHMGSLGSADRRVMRAVLGVVRDEGLLFVDSRTTTETVGEELAAEMGIPAARRHVFLDNVDEEEAIRGEVQRLISLARVRGTAIAIGHANRLAPRVIAQMLEEFDRHGVTLVLVSDLVR
jgi:polysaccharide deacetylase 2 family uncharacterized protein YibQ